MNDCRISRVLSDRRQFLASAAAGFSVARVGLGESNEAPSPATAEVPLGLNLAPVRYWGSEHPFQNLFSASSPHVPLKQGGRWNDGGPLALDAEGWVKKYQPQQHSAFIIDLGQGLPQGEYRIQYDGAANAIRVQGSRDNRTVIKTQPKQRVLVHVHSPIRNVTFARRGQPIEGTFSKTFLARCQQFPVLRFMDWGGINEDRDVNWDTRITPRHYTQAGGEVALEFMVQLCNEANAGMWHCVHHLANDDYVRKTAQYVRKNLDPSLPIYVEHSNEVWNGMFPQHKYCKQQSEQFLDYHIQRTADIASLFRQEGVTLTSVLGLQCAATWAAEQALQRGCPEGIDATAIAPYFGGHVGRKPDAVQRVMDGGIAAVVDECQTSIQQRRAEIQKHREIADQHKLDVLGYEGGQHLVAVGPNRKNEKLVDLLIRANRDDAMYDLYLAYHRMWTEATDGSLMCLYYSVGEFSKSGSWGLLEYDGQPKQQAPKYRAIVDLLANA